PFLDTTIHAVTAVVATAASAAAARSTVNPNARPGAERGENSRAKSKPSRGSCPSHTPLRSRPAYQTLVLYSSVCQTLRMYTTTIEAWTNRQTTGPSRRLE